MNFQNIFSKGTQNPGAIFSLLVALPKFVRLFFRLLRDPRVSRLPKILFLSAIIYFILPLDFFPELFFSVFGYADDIFALFMTARFLLRSAPAEVVSEHVAAIQAGY